MTIINTTKRIPAVSIVAGDIIEGTSVEINLPAVLSVAFADGRKMAFDVLDLTPEILGAALVHGLRQKLGDAAAIARNTETGASATLADKINAVMEVAERLSNGEWNKTTRETSGASLLVEALAEMKNVDASEIVAMLAGKTDEYKNTLAKNPRVAAVILKIKSERAAKRAESLEIDTDELLADLGI